MSTATAQDPRWYDDLNYRWSGWFLVVHLLGLCGMFYAYLYAPVETIVFTVVYFFLCHLSITCGAHRLYAHVSYRAGKALQYTLLTLFSAVFQGPMAWWRGKHRQHHRYTDQLDDPHSPVARSFFFGHMGWMCTKEGVKTPPSEYMKFGKSERKPVFWQLRNHWRLTILMGIVVPVGVCGIWDDWLGGILVAVFARLVFQYHLTWVVNSVGHRFGQRVKGGGSARNVPLLGILTVGESYHAFHHQDDTSWKLGRRWYDLDPGKWLIWLLIQVGLAEHVARKRTA